MRVIKHNKATGGYNISTKGGAVLPLYRMKTEGLGQAQTEEFYEKANSKNHFETIAPKNLKGLEGIKLKSSRPKKFISLNI